MRLWSVLSALRTGLGLNLRYLRRSQHRYKSGVEKYPDVISGRAPLDMFTNFRGYVRNDLAKCTGCGACVPTCPVKAIDFTSDTRPDGTVNVQEFRIDLGKCFSCNACVEVCPEQSLFYSKDFEIAASKPADLISVQVNNTSRNDKDITRIRTYEVRR